MNISEELLYNENTYEITTVASNQLLSVSQEFSDVSGTTGGTGSSISILKFTPLISGVSESVLFRGTITLQSNSAVSMYLYRNNETSPIGNKYFGGSSSHSITFTWTFPIIIEPFNTYTIKLSTLNNETISCTSLKLNYSIGFRNQFIKVESIE